MAKHVSKHRKVKISKRRKAATSSTRSDLEDAQGIAPGWVLAYLTVKEVLANVPWTDWWTNTFEFGDRCEDKLFHFIEWLMSLFM